MMSLPLRQALMVGALGLGGLSASTSICAPSSAALLPSKSPSKLKIEASIEAQSNLYDKEDAAHEASVLFDSQISYGLSPRFKAALQGGFSKDFTGEQKTLLGDSSLKTSYRVGEVFNKGELNLGLSALIPTSKDSRKNKSTYTVLSFAPKLAMDLEAIGLKHLSASVGLSFSAGFYQFETSATGASNKPFGQKTSLALSWTPKEWLELAASFAQANAWTFEGNLVQSFEFEQSLQFSVDQVAIAFGHRNGGNALKANGQDSNIAVFNSNTSVLFSALSAEF